MKKKDKKSKDSELKERKKTSLDNRFEIAAKIDDLKVQAQNSYLSGNYNEAIKYAEEIINLAVQSNITSYVKDQEKFINVIADKLQKEYLVSEIKDVATGIQQIYETLSKTNKIEKAHEILDDFKNKYHDFPEFESIPIVQDLIIKDYKEWIRFNASQKEITEEKITKDEREKDFDSTIDEIQKFLRTR